MSDREERKARRELRKGKCPTCHQELPDRPKPSERREMVSRPLFQSPGDTNGA